MTQRLDTYNPAEREEKIRHENNKEMQFLLTCWNCKKDFDIWIGWENLHASIFRCTHCKQENEID